MFCRRIFCTSLSLVITLSVSLFAQTKVWNSSGEPIIGAIVLDGIGMPIGFVDKDGIMPEVGKYPVTIRCLGYEDAVLEGPTAQVDMNENAFGIRKINGNPENHPACRVICYVRENSGLSNFKGKGHIIAEYMVDFMFKVDKKAKKVQEWNVPRVLNSEILSAQVDGKVIIKNDSIEMDTPMTSMFINLATIPLKIDLPKDLKGLTYGKHKEKSIKTGMEKLVYDLTPQQLSIREDAIADFKGHKYSPYAFKLVEMNTDFLDCIRLYNFEYDADQKYDASNLTAMTVSCNMIGKGKRYRKMFNDDPNATPLEMCTYFEVYPVAVEYLTQEEAVQVQKNPEKYPMTKPAGL